jgi:hypothetical protein
MVRDAFDGRLVGAGEVRSAASAGRVTVRVYVSVLGGMRAGRGVRTFHRDVHTVVVPRRQGRQA